MPRSDRGAYETAAAMLGARTRSTRSRSILFARGEAECLRGNLDEAESWLRPRRPRAT